MEILKTQKHEEYYNALSYTNIIIWYENSRKGKNTTMLQEHLMHHPTFAFWNQTIMLVKKNTWMARASHICHKFAIKMRKPCGSGECDTGTQSSYAKVCALIVAAMSCIGAI